MSINISNSNQNLCNHKIVNGNYCIKCGAISNEQVNNKNNFNQNITCKHIKYKYETELSPIFIFNETSKSNSEINFIISENNINKYKEKRKDLLYLIRNVNRKLDFNSQTFFLSLLFMDKIFSLENLTIENVNDYYLYSLCCLIIASKFNENDPHIPDLNSYNKIFNEVSKFQYNFSRDEIRNGEVIILNLLKYKLNYYSIYHFLVFFFVHGIIFEFTFKKIKERNEKYLSQKTYLEKVYLLSRELLDLLIEDTKNFEIINVNDNYLIAAIILIFSIEKTLKINLDNNENVFVNIYKLKYNVDEYKKIQNIIEEIYNEKIQNNSPRIVTSNINNNYNNNQSTSNKKTKTNSENIENKSSNKIIISPNNRIYIDSGHYYQTNNDNFNNNTFVRLHSSNNYINPKLNSDNKLIN